jgi:hypothetical protein
MAICAPDIAFFDFSEYLSLRKTSADHLTDAHDLDAAAMVKLKNDHIPLAAVNARVIVQIGKDE